LTCTERSSIRHDLPSPLTSLTSAPAEFAATWRTKQIEYTFLLSLMGRFLSFSEVTEWALRASAERHRVSLTPARVGFLVRAWRSLPPFPDVTPALTTLKDRYTLSVLSNGDAAMLRDVLRHSGLKGFFSKVISAEEVGVYKPSPRVYARAAERLSTPLREVVLVSSNPFDVLGAKSAGMPACWVNRADGVLDDLGIRPDLEVRGLEEVASALGSRWPVDRNRARPRPHRPGGGPTNVRV